MPTVHLIIKGKVQGVFYRSSAKERAKELALTGWIRNRQDGNVEAVVTGPESQVDVFVDWCRSGPAGAVVTGLVINSIPLENFDAFTIRKG